MVFCRSLSESKSAQVSRILHRILANLNNAVVWKVSIRPFISNSPSPSTNLLVNILRVPITIDMNATSKIHSFFSLLVTSRYLSPFSLSFSPLFGTFFFFKSLLTISRSGLQAKTMGSVCISKSQRILCISFLRTDCVLCLY